VTVPPHIEAARVVHAALLAELHAACFDEVWSAGDIATLLNQPGVFGALALDDAPVGFLLWRVAADEAEILSLGVLPPARRHGIATVLLETAVAALRTAGVTSLFLEVAQDNRPARAFYQTHGFAEVGRRRSYYHRPSAPDADALVLKLTFPLGIRT